MNSVLPARKPVPVAPVYPPRHTAVPATGPRLQVGESVKIWIIAIVCFLLGLVVIAQYSKTVSLGYEISRCRDRLSVLDEEYRQMELDAAGLASLDRIEMVAREELGMQEPQSNQVRVLTAHKGN